MTSIVGFIVYLIVHLVIAAWMIAVAARWVGSDKGRFLVGLRVVLLLTLINIVFTAAALAVPVQPRRALIPGLFLLLLQICIFFRVMRQSFKLSFGRTFAPFGAYALLAVLQVAAAILIIKPYVYEAFVVPTKSMDPTIEVGDRILVCKLLKPQRWDLITYWHHDPAGDAVYVKRLVGLPGDQVQIDGEIRINGSRANAPPVFTGPIRLFPGDYRPRSAPYREGQTITLGPDEYFVIGDNAEISIDSRLHGPVKFSDLVGVADLLYWPPRRFQVFR